MTPSQQQQIVVTEFAVLESMISSKIEPIYDIIQKGKPVMSYEELEEMLPISRTLINRYVENGQLISAEVGNRTVFMLEDVLSFIKSMRVIDPTLLRKKQK